LTPHKIRVVAIGPGAIQTPINTSAWDTPEALAKLLTLTPYTALANRMILASSPPGWFPHEADYITGTTIFMDGGMTLYPGFADNG